MELNPKDFQKLKTLLPIFLLILLASCGKNKQEAENVLLRYGNHSLTYEEVVEKIPGGLTPTDSAALFKSIVEGWISDVVLSEFAEQRLYDLQAIERKVEEYRNNLIVQEYLSRMGESQSPKIEEAKVKEYYDVHRNDLKLEVPLVKGVFLKINSDASKRDQIKGLLSSDDPDKIDKLESDWLDKAIQYDYFRDKWVDWQIVSGMIPYRFGDADQFLETHNYFETEDEDCAYYLYIYDWLKTGEEQPYEFAKGWIANTLTQGSIVEYEKTLVKSIVEKSLKENKLEAVGYDPVKQELIQK